MVIGVIHTRAGIHTNVEGLIVGQDERDCVWNLPRRHLRAIHPEDTSAALGYTRPAIGKVEYNRVFPGPKRLWGFPTKTLDSQQVVKEYRLALEQVESITVGLSPLRDQHPFSAATGDLDVGCDGERTAQDRGRAAKGNAGHFAIVGEQALAGSSARATPEREHVVFPSLLGEQILQLLEL